MDDRAHQGGAGQLGERRAGRHWVDGLGHGHRLSGEDRLVALELRDLEEPEVGRDDLAEPEVYDVTRYQGGDVDGRRVAAPHYHARVPDLAVQRLGRAHSAVLVDEAEALHGQIRHTCVVVRGGHPAAIDVTALVPGDVVDLRLGEIVPADLRLLEVAELECDESILTGESMPVAKSVDPVPPGAALAELTGAALMGTVVHAGSGTGVVVATGSRAEFGRIAQGLSEGEPETEFQAGLRQFSVLLVQVAAILTVSIFAINLLLHLSLIHISEPTRLGMIS